MEEHLNTFQVRTGFWCCIFHYSALLTIGSCIHLGANFLGEIIEWIGFAVTVGGLPAISFAVWTASNIGPRAVAHHQWYQNKFGDKYPKNRKALIPFIF